MIDPRKSNVVDVESVIQGLGTDASTVESQIRLISSRFQLEQLASDLGIFNDPEFNAALRNPDRTVQMQVAGPFEIPRLLAAGVLAGRHGARGRTGRRGRRGRPGRCSMRRQSKSFGDGLKVTPEGRSYVIKVAFTSESPSKAATIVNAVANDYVDMLRDEKVDKTKLATEWLAQRLDELRAEVETAEGAVEHYRADNNINDVNGVTLNEQRLFDVNQRLSALRADEAAAKAKIAQIRAMRTQPASTPSRPCRRCCRRRRSSICAIARRSCSRRSPICAAPSAPSIRGSSASSRRRPPSQHKIQAEVDRILKTIENDAEVTASRIKALEERDQDRLRAAPRSIARSR